MFSCKTVFIRRLFCFIFVFGLATSCFAQQGYFGTDKNVTADVLKSDLFAKTAEEKQFCDDVIRMRDAGTIPTRLIYGVYRKAVTKELPHRFQYFKMGLEIVCKQEGIMLTSTKSKLLPSLSSRIVSSFKNFFKRKETQ